MKKYESRVDIQKFLNRPGHHDGAFIRVYVEDTTNRGVVKYGYGGEPSNYEPRMILQVADCSNKIDLEFNLGSTERRANTFHKIDTMIDKINAGQGTIGLEILEDLPEVETVLLEESTLYKQRQRALDEFTEFKKTDADREREAKAAEKTEAAEKFFADRGVQVEVEHD